MKNDNMFYATNEDLVYSLFILYWITEYKYATF